MPSHCEQQLFNKRSSFTVDNDELITLQWPQISNNPLTWRGKGLTSESSYIYNLSESDLAEIVKALAAFNVLERPFYEVDSECFPLPKLGPVLKSLSCALHQGLGFFILRGIDPGAFSREENISIYLGISSYVAECRAQQNPNGRMLTHVTRPRFMTSQNYHPVHSNAKLPFHTDFACDVLALYCLHPGSEGGNNVISSSWKIYDELVHTRPDLLEILAQSNWIHTPFHKNAPPTSRALLHLNTDKQPILNFSMRNLLYVTPTQQEALDAVQEIACRHKLETAFQEGDIRFINNLAILHSREAFLDESSANKRHLLRLWLRSEELGWQIPSGLELEWKDTFGGAIGSERWDVEPLTEQELYDQESSKCG